MPFLLRHGCHQAAYGGAVAYSPLNESPNLFYDISNLSTLWKDTAGTVPVTTDGDLVARVDDLSGNGGHLLQPTSSLRPLYKTAGGLSWLEFDGVDDFIGASYSNTGPEVHAYLAFRPIVGSAWGRLVSMVDNDANPDYDRFNNINLIGEWASDQTYVGFRAASQLCTPLSMPDGTDFVVDAKYSNGYRIRANGSTSSSGGSGTTNFAIARCNIGGVAAGGSSLHCRVYGAVVKNTPFESASLITWLGAKAGLTL